ncbi:TonB-dependent receptor [Ochrovirga pacifica]|uniref:TonB-dependent receptor n=1 Tax=Ochrovirga pacifica TaxID=1042376 RepID=UPI0002558B45|nr:TonB-dependent receptor [Ochrovirga pacifica]
MNFFEKFMMKNVFFVSFVLLLSNTAIAQHHVQGKVLNKQQQPIASALVKIANSQKTALTNENGMFVIENLPTGTTTLHISSLGYKAIEKGITLPSSSIVTVELETAYQNLNTVVVTGTFAPRKQMETSTSVSVLSQEALSKLTPRGTADLIGNVSGTFTDASAGEVYTKVYTRGVSAAAEDDLGWYYTSLQEDGLPVSLIQHSYYSPDLFYRSDLTTQRLEAVRGGSASVTAMNAPGGIYNFISQDKREGFGGQLQITSGIQGKNNAYQKYEFLLNGALGNDWFYNVGGHYRKDEGAREVDFTFSKGGQVKLNFIKENDRGFFKFYAKVLDDRTNRWNGVTANNWNNPTAVYGQSFRHTSQLLPSFSATIPTSATSTSSFDPSQGVHAKDLLVGMNLDQKLGNDWSVKNNVKFSSKSANWQTTISNAFVSIDNPLAYFITGAGFPIGNVVFRDANNGQVVAGVNNSAILVGGPAAYTQGSLPNNALLGGAAWYKNTETTEIMDRLVFRKKADAHDINLGIDYGFSDMEHFTNSSFVFATYENNPRNLVVTLENPGSPVFALSDANGVSNYGGLFFEKADATLHQTAVFVNDVWKITPDLSVDAGLRYEHIFHKGNKHNAAPLQQDGGFDGDATTDYDNGVLVTTGATNSFDFDYNYFSYSLGLNYKLQANTSLFSRYSKGNKAPEFDYYFNNFSNVAIPKKGEVQEVHQIELGLKHNAQQVRFAGTVFYSLLKNIGNTNFEFNGDTNTVFYTPTQFNSSNTLGVEFEAAYQPFSFLTLQWNGVYQKATSEDWTVYNANGTVDESDDSVQNFNDKNLPFNPELMFDVKALYEQNQWYAFATYHYMGKRYGNIANAFELPSYGTFDVGAGLSIEKHWNLSVNVVNLLNSDGLANFFGPNSFGGNANQVNADYIANNPNGNFIVVPILPRGIFTKLNYTF